MSSPEKPDHGTAQDPSESEASLRNYVLRAEAGRFTLTGFPVALTVEGPPESPTGRRVESKPATGGLAASQSAASGTTWTEFQDPLARGRANEAHRSRSTLQGVIV